MNLLRIMLVTLPLASPAVAAEPPDSTDDALLRRLLGEDATEASSAPDEAKSDEAVPEPNVSTDQAAPAVDPQALERLLSGLRTAEQRLAEGETGTATRTAQSDVIAELDRLIEEAKKSDSGGDSETGADSGSPQQQPGATGSPEPTPQDAGQPAGASGLPAGAPNRNREGKAEESSDRLRDDHDPTGRLGGLRSDLVRDAWGHLPPRLREQLLNAGPDKYLPQYDSLVRRYFESLAQPSGSEPASR